MSTAQAALGPLAGIDGRRVSPAAAFWNLFVKEFRESRPAMIVGVFTFWLMPVFLGLTACLVARSEALQVFGAITYALLLCGGWLFAAAFGTNIVCRDWGRSEEHFLLAQPVTPRLIVGAKLVAAMAVIGLIVLTLLGIVHLLMLLTVDTAHRENLLAPEALVICLVGVSLALSFSIAVITRQTSTSLVLTMLIMALGVAAPLVSTRFSFLHPDWDMANDLARHAVPGRGTSFTDLFRAYGSFALTLVVCVAGSLTAAFVLCARERAIRIGHKPLAWTVALAALLLFGAGMMEVGRSAEICDRVRLCFPGLNRTDSVLHHDQDGGYAVCSWESTHLLVATFRVGVDGTVNSLRSNEVPLSDLRLSPEPGGEVLAAPSRLDHVERDGSNGLTIVGPISHHQLFGRDGMIRLKVRWQEDNGFQQVSAVIAGKAADSDDRDNEWWAYSRSATDRYAYLLYEGRPKQKADAPIAEDDTSRPRQVILRVYDWSTGPQAAKVLDLPLPARCSLRRVNSRLAFCDFRSSSLLGTVPLDDLQAIRDLFAKGMPQRQLLSNEEKRRLERGGSHMEWQPSARFVHNSSEYQVDNDHQGLLTRRIIGAAVSDPVRAFRYSPFAGVLLFRGGGLQAVDSALLAEEGPRALVFYDLSDPFRIRQVGFHNTMGYWQTQVQEADGHLLVLERGELTVLKRPKTARAGMAIVSERSPSVAGGG